MPAMAPVSGAAKRKSVIMNRMINSMRLCFRSSSSATHSLYSSLAIGSAHGNRAPQAHPSTLDGILLPQSGQDFSSPQPRGVDDGGGGFSGTAAALHPYVAQPPISFQQISWLGESDSVQEKKRSESKIFVLQIEQPFTFPSYSPPDASPPIRTAKLTRCRRH